MHVFSNSFSTAHHSMISLTPKLSGTSAPLSSVPSPSDVNLSFSFLLRLLSHICAKAFRLATDAVLEADLPDAAFRNALGNKIVLVRIFVDQIFYHRTSKLYCIKIRRFEDK